MSIIKTIKEQWALDFRNMRRVETRCDSYFMNYYIGIIILTFLFSLLFQLFTLLSVPRSS